MGDVFKVGDVRSTGVRASRRGDGGATKARDGDKEDAWKRAAVDALLGVACAMERSVALDSYEFQWCYPGEEYLDEDMNEFAECEAAGLCPPMLRSYCGKTPTWACASS